MQRNRNKKRPKEYAIAVYRDLKKIRQNKTKRLNKKRAMIIHQAIPTQGLDRWC
jgi:hypothetical protein